MKLALIKGITALGALPVAGVANVSGIVKTQKVFQNSPTNEDLKISYWQNKQKNSDGSYHEDITTQRDQKLFKEVHENGIAKFNDHTKDKYIDIGANKFANSVGYEIFIRSFSDSDGDGIGDFNGVTNKIQYLKDLGIDRIWMMPWFASPSLHKYDALSYYDVDSEYGSLSDFKKMVKTLNDNNIKLDIDLAFNHTSKWSPWFTDAISDWVDGNKKGSEDRSGWYRFEKEIPQINGKNAKNWFKLPKNKGYYFGAFGSYMPDLNLDNKAVQAELMHIVEYWKKLGVSGIRLDAPKEAFDIAIGDELPGQTLESSIKKNRDFWKSFAGSVEDTWKDTYIVGENWEDDEANLRNLIEPFSEFAFPWRQKIISTVNRQSVFDNPTQNKDSNVANQISNDINYYKEKNPKFLSTNFLSNHDRPRVRNALKIIAKNTEYKAFVAANMMMALPGMPMIYYGDELMMNGYTKDNIQAKDTMYRLGMPWGKNDSANTNWINNKLKGSPSDKYDTYQEYDAQTLYDQYLKYSSGKTLTKKELEAATTNNILNHYKELIKFRHKYGKILQSAVNVTEDTFSKDPNKNPGINILESKNKNLFGLNYRTPNDGNYLLVLNISDGWGGVSGGDEIYPGHLKKLWDTGISFDNGIKEDNDGFYRYSFGPKSMVLFKVLD